MSVIFVFSIYVKKSILAYFTGYKQVLYLFNNNYQKSYFPTRVSVSDAPLNNFDK